MQCLRFCTCFEMQTLIPSSVQFQDKGLRLVGWVVQAAAAAALQCVSAAEEAKSADLAFWQRRASGAEEVAAAAQDATAASQVASDAAAAEVIPHTCLQRQICIRARPVNNAVRQDGNVSGGLWLHPAAAGQMNELGPEPCPAAWSAGVPHCSSSAVPSQHV